MKNQQVQDAHLTIELVKRKLRQGADYKECRAEAQPALDVLNEEGRRIAKKYGQRYKKLSFTAIMR